MEILKVTDKAFRRYGRIVEGIPCADIIEAMEKTPCPADEVIYIASVPELEACASAEKLALSGYGGMPIQVGCCNGFNKYLNAAEYHRDSEINIACTDLILILGKEEDMEEDFTYDTAKMEAFLVPKGTVIEVFATTFHYAPCSTAEAPFRMVVVLPRGTNTDLAEFPKDTPEDRILFARNKWLIGHPDAAIPGAWNGLKGENLHV